MDISKIKDVYSSCFSAIYDCKRYIQSIVMVFFLGIVLGATFPDTFNDTLMPILKDLVRQVHGLSPTELMVFIFHNNFTTAVLAMLSGLLLFFMPYFHASANGVLVGFVLQRVAEITGASNWWQLIPHGLFEIPAFFIALGMGVHLGLFWWKEDKLAAVKQRLLICLKTLVLVIAPLLAIASVIEASLI